MSAKRALARFKAPDEPAAEERAWATVRAAYQEHERIPQAHSRAGLVLVFAATLALAAIALSPAGATVGRLITRALGVQHAAARLSSLPASGRLLVSGPDGAWTISADGSTRRLGPWSQASWSPHGRYLVVATGDRLVAIDPHGSTQWMLRRPALSDPRWFSPSGYRVAYLSGGNLRVVAGDGTGDHLLASAVADVAPAWRPGHAFELAYVTRRQALVVRDGDTGRVQWARHPESQLTKVQWAADGSYLLAVSPSIVRLYSASGTLRARIPAPRDTSVTDAALSPNGKALALVLRGAGDEVVLENPLAREPSGRRVLTGTGLGQLLWSPNGQWLLVGWPAADQLVFVGVAGPARIAAVSHIAEQFSTGGRAGAFPELDGWCCQAHR